MNQKKLTGQKKAISKKIRNFCPIFVKLGENEKVILLEYQLNPIPTGGGHYGPDDRKWSAISIGFGLGSPKFMTLFLSMFDRPQ